MGQSTTCYRKLGRCLLLFLARDPESAHAAAGHNRMGAAASVRLKPGLNLAADPDQQLRLDLAPCELSPLWERGTSVDRPLHPLLRRQMEKLRLAAVDALLSRKIQRQ